MRGTLLAMLVAAGIGLVGTAGVSAAPINGAVIGDAANATSPVETVQHWRWGSRAATGVAPRRSLALGKPWRAPLPSARIPAAGAPAGKQRPKIFRAGRASGRLFSLRERAATTSYSRAAAITAFATSTSLTPG